MHFSFIKQFFCALNVCNELHMCNKLLQVSVIFCPWLYDGTVQWLAPSADSKKVVGSIVVIGV